MALLGALGMGLAGYRFRAAVEARAREAIARVRRPAPSPATAPESSALSPVFGEAASPPPSQAPRHVEVFSASPDEPAPEGNVFRLKGKPD